MLKFIAATHRSFFCQRVNNILFQLIVSCKTSERGADLEGPLIFKLFHS